MRRDTIAMLFWALRRHEGHRVADRLLEAVLWGKFALKPKDSAGTLRALMSYVQERYSDRWIIEDCEGRGFRIVPRVEPKGATNERVGQRARGSEGAGAGK